MGVGLACLASSQFIDWMWVGGGILAFFGFLCCLFSYIAQPHPLTISDQNAATHSIKKNLIILFSAQCGLLIVSIVMFYLLEVQTQLNSRLHFLDNAYIFQKLQQHSMSLGLLPWILYSVLGIGLAYLSITENRAPVLSRAIVWKKKGKLELFWSNMSSDVVHIVSIGPFLFVVSLIIIWFVETINALLKWDSIFLEPFRTTFICALIILVFRKGNQQLIEWMNQSKISVGKAVLLYALAISFFILWLHGFSDWLTIGKEISIPNTVLKSSLAGSFSETVLQDRISLLVLGWWIIWIPWMASVVARSSIGLSMIQALFQSLIIPVLLFCSLKLVNLENSLIVYQWLKLPAIQTAVLLVLILFIWKAWGNLYTEGDVARGAMLPIGKLSKRSLKRWMNYIIFGLIFYIPAWMMLGWLPMQMIVALDATFMLIVAASFIFAWSIFLLRRFAIRKNRAHQYF